MLSTRIVLLAALAAPCLAGEDSKPAKPVIYDEAADAKAEIAAALVEAEKNNRRVLIQWGANWCVWCHRLHDAFRGDRDVREKLRYEYDVVLVDVGRRDRNVDLVEKYGLDLSRGIPFLTVLDANGDVVVNQETGSLELDGERHDPEKILAFLDQHRAPYQKATDLLKAGKARAQQEGKRLFVHFGAPWCGNCRQLERWMERDDVRPLLEREFVDVKIDIDRTSRGRLLLDRTRTGEPGGIPWFCFFSPEGEKQVESNRTDGKNVGFPSSEADHAHFRTMLETGAIHLTSAEIDRLVLSLKE